MSYFFLKIVYFSLQNNPLPKCSSTPQPQISNPKPRNNLRKGKEIPSLEETEKFLIQKALEIFDGNRRKASETLGISERTLYRKLDQFGLEKK